MRMYFFSFFFICLLLSGASNACAASTAAKQLDQTYKNLTSIKADFIQILRHKESGGKETRSGTLEFKKPLLVRWETKAPSQELLVVTSKEIWNAFPDEALAYKYPLSMVDDSRSIIRVITGQARLEQDFSVEDKGREDGLAKLQIYPNEPVQSLVEATLWVDDGGFIRKLRIYDFYGNQNEIAFSNMKTGVSIPDSAFAYSPPKGTYVEDRSHSSTPAPKGLLR